MPTFIKNSIYQNVEFSASPADKNRTISSRLGWYRPYSPGTLVDIDISLKPIYGKPHSFRLYEFNNGAETEGWQITCPGDGTIFKIRNRSLAGQGALDYRFGYQTESDSKLVVSIVATHNDTWTILAAGSIFTLLCTIFGVAFAWLLSFINVIPKWNMWMPDFIVEFLKRMVE